jgi:hypothetical protein
MDELVWTSKLKTETDLNSKPQRFQNIDNSDDMVFYIVSYRVYALFCLSRRLSMKQANES